MKPIWYFVGLILAVIGAIVLGAGITIWFRPPANPTVLAELHPNLWWGAILLVSGLIFVWANRKKVVE